MIEARPGQYVTKETKGEANAKVDRAKRCRQILECLGDDDMTAKEIAVKMYQKGYIPTTERNFTAPRLTEMSQKGKVDTVGKTTCKYTGHTVAVYRKREEEE